MEPTLKAHLLTTSQLYAAALGIPLSVASRRAMRDGRFFARIDEGCTFTVRVYDRAMQWFSDNWPKNTKWPRGVPRPEAGLIPGKPGKASWSPSDIGAV